MLKIYCQFATLLLPTIKLKPAPVSCKNVGNNASKDSMEYNTGNFNGFYWFETSKMTIGSLIKQLPELFLNKYLVSMYQDGSPKRLKKAEVICLQTLKRLSTDTHDQWVLTIDEQEAINFIDFVNFTYFSLIDWNTEIDSLQDVDDKKFIEMFLIDRLKLKEQFWSELEVVNPYNFISDGSKLIFVTKDKSEVEKIINTIANQK